MEETTTIEPGFHDLNWRDYNELDGVRASLLNKLWRSPAACRDAMLPTPHYETEAQLIGRALHAAVLEPLTFKLRFKPLHFDGRTKSGKTEREELRGATGLNSKHYDAVQQMATSVLTHPRVTALLKTAEGMETSAVWKSRNRLCKARLDLWAMDWIADLKSCGQFRRFSPFDVTEYGYHRQAAWYMRGARHCGKTPLVFYFIVVANTPPYECGVFRLENDALRDGERENSDLFDEFLQCEKEDRWTNHYPQLLTARIYPTERLSRA